MSPAQNATYRVFTFKSRCCTESASATVSSRSLEVSFSNYRREEPGWSVATQRRTKTTTKKVWIDLKFQLRRRTRHTTKNPCNTNICLHLTFNYTGRSRFSHHASVGTLLGTSHNLIISCTHTNAYFRFTITVCRPAGCLYTVRMVTTQTGRSVVLYRIVTLGQRPFCTVNAETKGLRWPPACLVSASVYIMCSSFAYCSASSIKMNF